MTNDGDFWDGDRLNTDQEAALKDLWNLFDNEIGNGLGPGCGDNKTSTLKRLADFAAEKPAEAFSIVLACAALATGGPEAPVFATAVLYAMPEFLRACGIED